MLLRHLNKPESLIKYVKDRPGHDRRYAMNSSKIRAELGWRPNVDFETGLERTVKWYIDNRDWWQRIKSGEYMHYYEKWYGNR
jgi:dTDP-glucose 4,6-dehydratase